MRKIIKPTPNTHLGEVTWYSNMFFGNLRYVCQDMLAKSDKGPRQGHHFLDTKWHIADLWDYFEEVKLENGCLGLELFADDSYHTILLALVETTIPYGEEVDTQTFLNIVEDFKEYVRTLPVGKPGDGALVTDPNAPNYHDEANQKWLKTFLEINTALSVIHRAVKKRARREGFEFTTPEASEDDVPF